MMLDRLHNAWTKFNDQQRENEPPHKPPYEHRQHERQYSHLEYARREDTWFPRRRRSKSRRNGHRQKSRPLEPRLESLVVLAVHALEDEELSACSPQGIWQQTANRRPERGHK